VADIHRQSQGEVIEVVAIIWPRRRDRGCATQLTNIPSSLAAGVLDEAARLKAPRGRNKDKLKARRSASFAAVTIEVRIARDFDDRGHCELAQSQCWAAVCRRWKPLMLRLAPTCRITCRRLGRWIAKSELRGTSCLLPAKSAACCRRRFSKRLVLVDAESLTVPSALVCE